jgi:ribonuclease HI
MTAFQSRLSAAVHARTCPTAAPQPRSTPAHHSLPQRHERTRSSATDTDPQGRNSPAPASTTPSVTPNDSIPTHEPTCTTPTAFTTDAPGGKRRKVTHARPPAALTTARTHHDTSDTPIPDGQAQTDRPRPTQSTAVPDGRHERRPERDAPIPDVAVDVSTTEWTLQFDGACRGRNATAAGAGALLMNASGTVVWTTSVYLTGPQTNNTAEYQALLKGIEGAIQHDCSALRIEGDSDLVIKQVRGEYSCKSKRLRKFRNNVRSALQSIESSLLVHVDRTANRQADKLANQALDRQRTRIECATHGVRATECTPQGTQTNAREADELPPTPSRTVPAAPIDDAETLPTVQIGPDSVPACRPRLRLRQLEQPDLAKVHAAMSTTARRLATRLRDAVTWTDGEGIIGAIGSAIYDALTPFAVQPREPRQRPERRGRTQRVSSRRADDRPSRTDDRPAAQHLNERLDALHEAQGRRPTNRRDVHRARRAAGRARAALKRAQLRDRFERDESGCVRTILAEAAATAATEHPPRAYISSEPNDTNTCPISATDVYGYFEGLHTARKPFDFEAPIGAPFRALLEQLPPPTKEQGVLCEDIDSDEVEEQLLRARRQSAPGYDGVGYDVLHQFREELLPLLHAAYTFCWRHKRLPTAWKVGVVRLVHKKGSRSVPSNWRPICLQPTLYKLYASILARRLSKWLEANERLTPAQKGFRAMNGCNEHSFTSTMAVDDARRREKPLYMVWYDLKNAFGAIPPALIWSTMETMGVNESFITCCRAIYSDSYYTVSNTADGATPPIAHRLGVYQGCPLSPFLFLIGVMPLIRRLHAEPSAGITLAPDVNVRVTAFADDIKTFSSTKAGIEKAHATMRDFLAWSTMEANPTKCAAFGSKLQGHRRVTDPPKLLLHGEVVPTIGLSDTYTYLGVGDGFDHAVTDFQLGPALKCMRQDVSALLRSGLRPAQIVKAIKVYIYSRIEYALRHVRVHRAQLDRWDTWLRRGLRHLLRLPQASSTAFFAAPTSRGGLGLLPLADMIAAVQVGHAWQMLHAPDPTVQAIARTQITNIAQRRYRLDPDHWHDRNEELVVAFLRDELKSSPHAERRRQSHDVTSLWTDVQQHARRLGFEFFAPEPSTATEPTEATDTTTAPTPTPALRTPSHREAMTKTNVMMQLKLHAKLKHARIWERQTDQGRTVRAHGRLGSAFITRPGGLHDRDYRFAVAARLNQLPTRSVLRRQRRGTMTRCRRPDCPQQAETLGHILNHCDGNNASIRARHDRVLNTIAARIREARRPAGNAPLEVKVNSTVSQVTGSTLRPDLQVLDHEKKTAVIADLAVAFDATTANNNGSGLDQARNAKVTKYAPLARALQQQGWRVTTTAMVYGSLGSVHPANFKTYTEALGIAKRVAKQLDLNGSLDCIRASAAIWYDHAAATNRQKGRSSGTTTRE